jgi:hypothetical protein
MSQLRHPAALAILVLAVVAGDARAADPAGGLLAGLGWLRELAGHCWRGEQADGTVSDIQCYELQFDRHLRGTIELPGAQKGDAPKLRGDSVWSWDPARQKIVVVTWSAAAPVAQLEATLDGELIRFAFGPNARSTWQRTGADGYTVVRERRDGDDWREDRRVTYRRSPAR